MDRHELLAQALRAHPEVKVTLLSSGCPETDAKSPPCRLFVCGPATRAEVTADLCEGMLEGLRYSVRRTGPREMLAQLPVRLTEFSDETVSF